jgi:hypothetical protein
MILFSLCSARHGGCILTPDLLSAVTVGSDGFAGSQVPDQSAHCLQPIFCMHFRVSMDYSDGNKLE